MAVDTLPFNAIFPVCRKILDRELRLIHYAELTRLALVQLGLNDNDVNWQRQIEDVREKMLLAGQYDTFYTGKPHCLAGVSWWFESSQLRLLNPSSGVVIPGDATAGADGAFEALMRDPFMKVKTSAPCEKIARGRANGIVLEKHVAYWFQTRWPEFYLPPDNEGQWSAWCDHDFKLKINGNTYKIDVSGKKLNGSYGNPGQGKRRVDFHLICEIVNHDIIWRSVYRGKNYTDLILPEGQSFGGIWPERMIVWLNCLKHKLDYRSIIFSKSSSNLVYAVS